MTMLQEATRRAGLDPRAPLPLGSTVVIVLRGGRVYEIWSAAGVVPATDQRLDRAYAAFGFPSCGESLRVRTPGVPEGFALLGVCPRCGSPDNGMSVVDRIADLPLVAVCSH